LKKPSGANESVAAPAASIKEENLNRVLNIALWAKGIINQIASSPDGKLIAAASPGIIDTV
jgi:hypothetical protein